MNVCLVLLAVGISHFRRGVQEESGADMDHEADSEISRKRNLLVSQTKGDCRVEKGSVFVGGSRSCL